MIMVVIVVVGNWRSDVIKKKRSLTVFNFYSIIYKIMDNDYNFYYIMVLFDTQIIDLVCLFVFPAKTAISLFISFKVFKL